MMTFNDIPENLRIPGYFIEFDPSRANTGTYQHKLLVIGQRLATGTVAEATPTLTSNAAQGENYFGRGAQLSHMLNYIFKVRPSMPVWAIGLDDLVAGVAASGSITFTGAASTAGTLNVIVGGEKVQVGVAAADAQDVIAAAVVAGITAKTDCPVTAAVDGGNSNQVNLTHRHKGELGNDLTVDVLFDSASQPTAPAIAITAMAGGTGNPDINTAIAAMGDEWYNWIIMPWTDSTNMTALETELVDRFSPLRQIGCRAFAPVSGTYGSAQAYGDSRNSPHVTCMGSGLAPQPAYIWAAVNAVVAANSLANDPSRQLRGLSLPYLIPPAAEDRFTNTERNNLLYDGISTYTVDAGGVVRIEAQITMYQENASGLPDDSMLYLNVPEVFERYRHEVRVMFSAYNRDKLADDGNKVPLGQPIMTPKKARGLMINLYRRMVEELAWCENLDNYKDTLLVEKTGNRLRIVDQPNFIDNFRQLFMRSELVN